MQGDVPQNLNYLDFETDFNNAHNTFSNTEENKKRKILCYNKNLTTIEAEKIIRCINK